MTSNDAWPSGRNLATPGSWLVPALALLAAATIGWFHQDEFLFRLVNGLTDVTGELLPAHVTALGAAEICASLVFLASAFSRRRSAILADALLCAVAGALLVAFVKWLAAPSARPLGLLDDDQVHLVGVLLKRNAMPSGHTAAAFVAAGLAWRHVRDRRVMALVLVLACGVAWSRLAVGVHWPRDVLVGAALGWSAPLLVARWIHPSGWQGRPLTQLVVRFLFLYTALKAALEGGIYPQAELFTRAVGVAALLSGLPWWWRLLVTRRPRPLGAGGAD